MSPLTGDPLLAGPPFQSCNVTVTHSAAFRTTAPFARHLDNPQLRPTTLQMSLAPPSRALGWARWLLTGQMVSWWSIVKESHHRVPYMTIFLGLFLKSTYLHFKKKVSKTRRKFAVTTIFRPSEPMEINSKGKSVTTGLQKSVSH